MHGSENVKAGNVRIT